MMVIRQDSVPDVIANVDNLLILTSGTEQCLIICKNKKYIFLLTTTLTINEVKIYSTISSFFSILGLLLTPGFLLALDFLLILDFHTAHHIFFSVSDSNRSISFLLLVINSTSLLFTISIDLRMPQLNITQQRK